MGQWDKILDHLKRQFRPEQFNIWFKTLQCKNLNDDSIEIVVPSDYYKNWIQVHFLDDIAKAVEEVLESPRRVLLSVKEAAGAVQNPLPLAGLALDEPPTPMPPPSSPSPLIAPRASTSPKKSKSPRRSWREKETKPPKASAPPSSKASQSRPRRATQYEPAYQAPPPSNLNPRYTFDAYVVGPSNQLAHAACLAIARNPAQEFNPLFLYGGVGLGKTHLMQAVGNSVISQSNGKMRVIYRSSEEFMNELITSIERKQMHAFREHYRTQCDVLLIDDIQLIAGKERTQEEFFHTFNALHNSYRQIILTSDKTPQEIPALEERLQSRFCWGLIADIQPPEVETRIAILRKKVAREDLNIPSSVVSYLAHNIDTNVRELEGSLRRINAHATLTGEPLTVELAKSLLGPLLQPSTSQLSPEIILKVTARHFEVKIEDIKGRGRVRAIAYPRQIAMYLVRELTSLSYPEIGRTFGKDHTTIINAYQKIEKSLAKNDPTRKDVDAIKELLLS